MMARGRLRGKFDDVDNNKHYYTYSSNVHSTPNATAGSSVCQPPVRKGVGIARYDDRIQNSKRTFYILTVQHMHCVGLKSPDEALCDVDINCVL